MKKIEEIGLEGLSVLGSPSYFSESAIGKVRDTDEFGIYEGDLVFQNYIVRKGGLLHEILEISNKEGIIQYKIIHRNAAYWSNENGIYKLFFLAYKLRWILLFKEKE